MKDSKDKLYTFTLIACMVVLLVAFILTLVNVLDLTILSKREFTRFEEFFVNSLLFSFNIAFLWSCVERNIFKIFLYSCTYMTLHFPIDYILTTNLVVTSIIPNIFIVLCIIIRKNDFTIKIIKLFVGNLFCVIYQSISMKIKLSLFDFNYASVNPFVLILFSIDLFLFYFLYWKGSEKIEKYIIMARLGRKYLVFTKTKSVQRVQKTSETHLSTEGLTRKQAVVFMALAFGFQLFQLGVVLSIGQINNMFLETITILGVFWAARETVGKCYHADTLLKCSAITFISFYVLTKVTPPLEISLFSVVCITAIYVYILHAVEMKREHIEYLESVISPENTMRKQCSDLGMSHLLTEICIDWKINGLSRQEQADKHGYSLATIKKYRNDINKALKSKRICDIMFIAGARLLR